MAPSCCVIIISAVVLFRLILASNTEPGMVADAASTKVDSQDIAVEEVFIIRHNNSTVGHLSHLDFEHGGDFAEEEEEEEYADEWPIYVAILGLTVFAYITWVLVYCLCQRRSASANLRSRTSSTPDLTIQQSYNYSVPNQNPIPTVSNGSFYRQSSTISRHVSLNPMSPECSLDGASMHEMVPPKYLQAMDSTLHVTNPVGLHESANNTLLNCNDDFGTNEESSVVPRLSASRLNTSPPGYSELTRISVVINGPESDDKAPESGVRRLPRSISSTLQLNSPSGLVSNQNNLRLAATPAGASGGKSPKQGD